MTTIYYILAAMWALGTLGAALLFIGSRRPVESVIFALITFPAWHVIGLGPIHVVYSVFGAP